MLHWASIGPIDVTLVHRRQYIGSMSHFTNVGQESLHVTFGQCVKGRGPSINSSESQNEWEIQFSLQLSVQREYFQINSIIHE